MVSYCMTKASALAFHQGLAAELRSESINAPEIKLTCVHPTWASTAMIAPHRAKIDGSGMVVIEPHVVADAVVKQIISGRGDQLILAAGFGFLSTLRAWPSWLSGGIAALTGT
jgi:all-trans-retinol dehydrogenase (NAD+)